MNNYIAGLNKTKELIALNTQKNKLLQDLVTGLIQKALADGGAELDVERRRMAGGTLPVGARLLWNPITNHVGETLRDEYLLTYDEFLRVAPVRELPNTSRGFSMMKERWNRCYIQEADNE